MVWPSNEEAKEEENENQYVMVQYIAHAMNCAREAYNQKQAAGGKGIGSCDREYYALTARLLCDPTISWKDPYPELMAEYYPTKGGS